MDHPEGSRTDDIFLLTEHQREEIFHMNMSWLRFARDLAEANEEAAAAALGIQMPAAKALRQLSVRDIYRLATVGVPLFVARFPALSIPEKELGEGDFIRLTMAAVLREHGAERS